MARTKGALGKWKPEVLLKNKERLQRKCVKLALAGNETCMRICMDRLYAKLRPTAPPIKIEAKSTDLAGKAAAVTDAVLAGRLPSDTGRDLLSALADVARLREVTELEQRLAALENNNLRPTPTPAPWESPTPQDERLPLRGKRRRMKNET